MKHRLLFVLLLLGAWPAGARAQPKMFTDPYVPVDSLPTRLLFATWCRVSTVPAPVFERVGNAFNVYAQAAGCSSIYPPPKDPEFSVDLGLVPAGTYTVRLANQGVSFPLVVAAASARAQPGNAGDRGRASRAGARWRDRALPERPPDAFLGGRARGGPRPRGRLPGAAGNGATSGAVRTARRRQLPGPGGRRPGAAAASARGAADPAAPAGRPLRGGGPLAQRRRRDRPGADRPGAFERFRAFISSTTPIGS